jgi:hypothetical protein
MTQLQDILLVFLAACRNEARRAKPEASLLIVFLCALSDLCGEQKKIQKMDHLLIFSVRTHKI